MVPFPITRLNRNLPPIVDKVPPSNVIVPVSFELTSYLLPPLVTNNAVSKPERFKLPKEGLVEGLVIEINPSEGNATEGNTADRVKVAVAPRVSIERETLLKKALRA
jgi:hypothetical protein